MTKGVEEGMGDDKPMMNVEQAVFMAVQLSNRARPEVNAPVESPTTRLVDRIEKAVAAIAEMKSKNRFVTDEDIAIVFYGKWQDAVARPVESPEELPPLTFRRNTCDTTLSGHMVISRGNEAPYAYTCAGVAQEICDAVNAYRRPAAAVPERTAEMEQLMGRLRELNGRGVLLYSSEVKILLDHIEGKGK